jgi:uncharacterized membrane protein YkvA (DUF1232 family)
MSSKDKEKNIKLIEKFGNSKVVVKENSKVFLAKLINIFSVLDVNTLWHIVTHPKSAKKIFNPFDLAIIVGAVAYVIVPVDAIPDWIPYVGMLDDAGVIAYVLEKFGNLMKKYRDVYMG